MTFISLLLLLALLGVAYYVVGQADFIAQPFKKLILGNPAVGP